MAICRVLQHLPLALRFIHVEFGENCHDTMIHDHDVHVHGAHDHVMT